MFPSLPGVGVASEEDIEVLWKGLYFDCCAFSCFLAESAGWSMTLSE